MSDVRTSIQSDTPAILAMSQAEPLFSAEDVECVEELLEDYFDDPDQEDYTFLTAEDSGEVAGYACYGPTPLTKGTYDLYWICVAGGHRRRGVGQVLLTAVEEAVLEEGGRLVTIDTSGLPAFAGTRAFYEGCGYRAGSRVPDFYGPGDDLVKYYRNLNGTDALKVEAGHLSGALLVEDPSHPQTSSGR
ncbi:MAG TPA: GNAT family N-acetyltransferase [Anaerolineales bacterium]|nr:GNAT family N-acetyltransferase [Anaerolineales bacterium]